jgi:subtilisin-like proprotein convertase family protein
MRKSLLALVALAPLAFAQTQTYTYSYQGLSLPIYPDDWDSAAVATILVPRSISITNVTATVQVQFSGVGDLNVYLWSPEGTRSKLLERNCGGLQNIDTTFDDSAPSRYSEFCPVEAGRGPFRGN